MRKGFYISLETSLQWLPGWKTLTVLYDEEDRFGLLNANYLPSNPFNYVCFELTVLTIAGRALFSFDMRSNRIAIQLFWFRVAEIVLRIP